jgi:hypothetical protein
LQEDAPVATIEARSSVSTRSNLSALVPYPFMVATGLNGSVGTLAQESPFAFIVATAHMSGNSVLAANAPFPFMSGVASDSSDYSHFILHNTEYGYIGNFNKTSPFPTIVGASS